VVPLVRFDGSSDWRSDLIDAIVDVDFVDVASEVLVLYRLDDDMVVDVSLLV
jgi:hypothetical protein